MPLNLTAERALIFRITHIQNVPWILRNGLHCWNAGARDPHFVTIGNPDLIERRAVRRVPVPPHGTLADYIPFYFTPHSPMHYNIHTGYRGLTRVDRSDLVFLVTSLRRLTEAGVPFVFTDRHAYPDTANFFTSPDDLGRIDWPLLRRRDFRRDDEDPDKLFRYEAEALVHRYLAMPHLLGIVCHDNEALAELTRMREDARVAVRLAVRPNWYFG
jgi:hypothetical protein